jgi:hypothetical protein
VGVEVPVLVPVDVGEGEELAVPVGDAVGLDDTVAVGGGEPVVVVGTGDVDVLPTLGVGAELGLLTGAVDGGVTAVLGAVHVGLGVGVGV